MVYILAYAGFWRRALIRIYPLCRACVFAEGVYTVYVDMGEMNHD